MAQISLLPWQELYDPITNDVIQTNTNTALNGKLYTKFLVSLEGQALQNMVFRKRLHVNGLLLLQELAQMYNPKNVPEVIATKTGEFWSNTKQSPYESIYAYYNRFHDFLDELSEAVKPILTKSAICHFIFILRSEFEAIQINFCFRNLQLEWNTQERPKMLVLCRDYHNSVNH